MIHKKLFNHGYTLIELMMVVFILSLLSSILTPLFDMTIQRAHQAKAKANLGQLRSTIRIYYSDQNRWPLAMYPEGLAHLVDGQSLTNILVPTYTQSVATPLLRDQMGVFNGITGSYDTSVAAMMKLDPPHDVFILWGGCAFTPGLVSPYVYDNHTGEIYIPNGNLDTSGVFFFAW